MKQYYHLNKSLKLTIISILIALIALNIPYIQGIGVGVTPSELTYTVKSDSIVAQDLWVINTGDIRTKYTLFFVNPYQSMFTFSTNDFELDPDTEQKVTVSYDPSHNPFKNDLNIDLNIIGEETNSIINTGFKVKVAVNHQISLSTTTSTTINEHNFPLNLGDTEITKALNYLHTVQQNDGSIGGFSTSCWVTMAIASAGYDPQEWKKEGNSIIDFLLSHRDQIDETKATDIAKFILALSATNQNPRNIDGVDYVEMLENTAQNNQIGDDSMYNDDFWGVLALISADVDSSSSIIQNSLSFIKDHQNNDGGWNWASGASDVDNTAAAIMALISAGENKDSQSISNAINYLESQLDSNGGFKFMDDANAASDSWAIMAIWVAEQNPTESQWLRNEVSPVDHLLTLQNQDGSFSWKEGQDGSPWWTAYAIPALLGKSYPISRESTSRSQAYIRIEDETVTIWRGWLEIPASVLIECYNNGNQYTIDGSNILALLDKASEIGDFTYQVSDQWYPDLGFYVNSIGGHEAEGVYGWLYRVNYGSVDVSMDNYEISASDDILIYWGTQNVRPLKLEIDSQEVSVNEAFTVTVKYREESNGEWLPLEGALIHVNDDYTTDSDGKAVITLSEEKVYHIYAEKWGDIPEEQFIRTDILLIGIGVPIPEFSIPIGFMGLLILISFIIIYLKKRS